MGKVRPFTIEKDQFVDAFKLVKANAGTAGIDGQSLQDLEKDLKGNLYKLWNRMSSGSYFPPPVKAVPIPKKCGGERVLGVPTVADRVAQMVVKQLFEPLVEPHFLPDSYGYRPGKSALDAVEATRKRCWQFNWVLEFDIRGLFDNIPHDLLLKAVRHHTDCKWIHLYIERWLKAPLQQPDGSLIARTKGTPQGGVISPVIANLFLHYTFDLWMQRVFPGVKWCRYADDALVHCRSEAQALQVKKALEKRLAECGLEMHPDKSQVVYCKDAARKGEYPNISFDFLGYSYRPRKTRNSRSGTIFLNFAPAVSKQSLKSMRAEIRMFRNRSDLSLQDIARLYNPKLRGWTQYYGRYHPSAMYEVYRHFNRTLVAWAMCKFKPLRCRKTRASHFLRKVATSTPRLFHHWSIGRVGTFV